MKATKTRFRKLTAWVLTLAMIMTFIPSFTIGVSADESLHGHPVCGASHTDKCDHTGACATLEWTEWTDSTTLPSTSGNYVLMTHVNVSDSFAFDEGADVKLCFNGYTIRLGASNYISVPEGNTFSIADCRGNGRIYAGGGGGRSSGPIRVSGTFNMYGVTIMNVTATALDGYGGGVWVRESGTFNMYGGGIKNNKATNDGGGVYNEGTFNMYGGEISGNTAEEKAQGAGGGVFNKEGATFRVGGDAVVEDNSNGENEDNVYLSNNSVITVAYQLADTASIGIANSALYDTPKVVATGAAATEAAFTSDKGYIVYLDGTDIKILKHVTHIWEYALDGENKIKATCTIDGCTGADGGSVTITVPASLTYTGEAIEADVTNSLTDLSTAVDVVYSPADSLTNGKPVNTGAYTASVTLGTEKIEVAYTVTPKSLSGAVVELSGYSFFRNNNEITPDVTSVTLNGTVLDTDDFTVSYSDNTDIGTATVTVTGKGNYKDTASTTFEIKEEIQYPLWVCGTQVTSINASDILGNGKVKYDADTSTLTFTDADISFADETAAIVSATGDIEALTIVGVDTDADGSNILTHTGANSAVSVAGNLAIEGTFGKISGGKYGIYTDGRLEITTPLEICGGTAAIAAHGGIGTDKVVVREPAEYVVESIEIAGKDEGYTTIGTEDGEGNFTAAKTVKYDNAIEYQVYVGDEQFNEAKLVIYGDEGMATYEPDTKTLTLDNFVYEGEGFVQNSRSHLIYVFEDNVTVLVKGENKLRNTTGLNLVSCGICSIRNIKIKGTDENSDKLSFELKGINASIGFITTSDGATVENCTINIRGQESNNGNTGMQIGGSLSLENTIIDVNDETNEHGITISYGTLSIADSTVTAYGTGYAIYPVTLDYSYGYEWRTSADEEFKRTELDRNGEKYFEIRPVVPEITEISFNTNSSAYNAETNTFAVPKDGVFEVYLKGNGLKFTDDTFYDEIYFGFVPDVANSENALAASLAEFEEEGFTVAVDTDTDTITLSFDYDAVKDFLGENTRFEGICYGDGNSIKEENIKSVNIVLKKYSSGGGGSSNTTTTTTKNDDGSTTKTTTNKSTGTVTEVTTYPDGSSVKVETKKDGTVTTTEKDADGTTTVTTENADGSATEVVTQNDGTKITTETTADGETTIEIDVPSGKETEVTVSVENAEDVTSVVVTDKDGNETTITDFEVTEDGIKISVSGDCTVAFGFAEKKIFDDVHPVNHWATADVDYTYINGLMKGTSENLFSPDMPLTRAMLVTVLYRLEGEPRVSGITSFSDLEKGQYYLDAVCWAQVNGIVYGISDTEFAPNQSITREQIAAIMHRYAQYKEIAPTGAWAIRLTYTDLAEISDYAAEGVMYCKLKEIMQGKGENLFAPKDNATRAEVAAILHRFIETN